MWLRHRKCSIAGTAGHVIDECICYCFLVVSCDDAVAGHSQYGQRQCNSLVEEEVVMHCLCFPFVQHECQQYDIAIAEL